MHANRHAVSLDSSAESLNQRFRAGKRIDLDRRDSSAVDVAHEEIPLAFTVRWHTHLRGG